MNTTRVTLGGGCAGRSAGCPAGRCGSGSSPGSTRSPAARTTFTRLSRPAQPPKSRSKPCAAGCSTKCGSAGSRAPIVTAGELVDRHLALLHATETSRRSHQPMARKHLRPLLGRLSLTAVTPEILDSFYAELRRCRDHCRHPAPGARVPALAPGTVRKLHYLLSGAYHRAVRWAGSTADPPRMPSYHPSRTRTRNRRRGCPDPVRRLGRLGPGGYGWPW